MKVSCAPRGVLRVPSDGSADDQAAGLHGSGTCTAIKPVVAIVVGQVVAENTALRNKIVSVDVNSHLPAV